MTRTAKAVRRERGTHLAGWDKRQFSKRKEKKEINKLCKSSHSPPADQCLSSPEQGPLWKNNYPILLLHMISHVIDYPSAQFTSSVPTVPHPSLLFTLSWLTGTGRSIGDLDVVQELFSDNYKTLASFQHCSGHQSITQHHMDCCMASKL